MSTVFLSIASALSQGSVILPNLIFSSLRYGHINVYMYILPFILLYSFEKSMIFALQGFGKINNPYKILKISLVVATAGAFVNILPFKYSKILGAIFIGGGLSIYGPLYKTVLDILKKDQLFPYKNALLKGYLCLFVLIALSFFYRKRNIDLIFIAFFILLLCTTIFVFKMDLSLDLKNNPMFIKTKDSWTYFLPFLAMLFLSFFTRNIKQTSNTKNLIYMFFGFFTILIIDNIFKKNKYHTYSFETLWYGACRNFIVIYSLIYFISIGENKLVAISYLAFTLGLIFSMILKNKLEKFFSNYNLHKVYILINQFCLLLLIIPKMYMVGIFLSSVFLSRGNLLTLKSYMEDDDFTIYEKRLIKAKFYNLGAIVQQFFLFGFIILISYIITGDGGYGLRPYVFFKANANLKDIYFIVRILSIFVLEIFAISLYRFIKKDELS